MASSCTSTSHQTSAKVLKSIDIDEIDGNFIAQEFARICLSENQSIANLEEFARLQGWTKATPIDLKRSKLEFLSRKILSIPGGGGRYYETQTLLGFNSGQQDLIVNMMERFDRQKNLVRTECALYAYQENHLPVCTAIGILLKRPPDSNQTFPGSNSHFIRWNAAISSKATSVRCDGVGMTQEPVELRTRTIANPDEFTGTIVTTIVDHQKKLKPQRAANIVHSGQFER